MPPGWAAARSRAPVRLSQGKLGSASPNSATSGLRGQGGHQRVVPVDDAHLRRTAGGAEVVEEVDIGVVVLRPLLRDVVLVVDRLDRAHGLAGPAVDALLGLRPADRRVA